MRFIQLGEGRYISTCGISSVCTLSHIGEDDSAGRYEGEFAVIDLCKGTPAKTAIFTDHNIVYLTNFGAKTVLERIQGCANAKEDSI